MVGVRAWARTPTILTPRRTPRGAPRERRFLGYQIARRSLEDDPATVVSGSRPDVDDPVRVRHDCLMVLDHDHGLAGIHESIQQSQDLVHIGEVKAGRGLVEHVDVALLPIWIASLMRWRSPPDSVDSGCPSDR